MKQKQSFDQQIEGWRRKFEGDKELVYCACGEWMCLGIELTTGALLLDCVGCGAPQ